MPELLRLKIDRLLFSGLIRKMDEFKLFSRKQANQRIQMGPAADKKDVFAHLMEASDPETGEGFQMPKLISEASILVIAGMSYSVNHDGI